MGGKRGKKSGPSRDVLSIIGTINTILPRAEVELKWVVGDDPDDVISQHYALSWWDVSAVYDITIEQPFPAEYRQTETVNKAMAEKLLNSMFLKSPAVVDLKMTAVIRETVSKIMTWSDKHRDQFATELAAAIEAEQQDASKE